MHIEVKNYSGNGPRIVKILHEHFGPAKFYPDSFADFHDEFKDYNFEEKPDRWAFGPYYGNQRNSRIFYFRTEEDAVFATLLLEG